MDERRVADYFVVAGLSDQPEPLGDFSRDGAHLKSTHNQAPITDITVIFPGLGENLPTDYIIIDSTPTGFLADLNHGSLRSPDVYMCYRRGMDKPPLVDIGVMYEGKERIMSDSEVVFKTLEGRSANVNNSAAKTFVTYRRATPSMPCNELVVTDICVILANKGETPPHAFCMINKNLNKGMVGSDVFLCYKKSMNRANLISYKPGILARYPRSDHAYFPFPASVPMFCLPMGSSVECWPTSATQPRPVFSTFVLTVSDAAQKVYGSAVTFYERLPRETLTSEQCKELDLLDGDDKTVNVNKCICLLSHWPFFDTFEKFLLFLYEMSSSGPHSVPIERHISHFLEDVPFPSPQRPRILVQLSASDRVILTQPEDLPLPRSGANFRELLMNLGPDNCLSVLLLALTEQKILVHSLRPDVLTAVVEAMPMIMFPFKWQCPYIPLCPMGLVEVLHAPLPFLIGVDSRFFDLYDPPSDVSCIDLDTNTITVCDEKRGLTAKLLPKKPVRALRVSLELLYQKIRLLIRPVGVDSSIDRDFQLKRKEQGLELEIQEAFLRFMATILKGYRVYLLPITKAPTIGTTDPNSLFDLQSFLRSRDKTHHKFFALVMKTQMFIRFIEERSFVSDMDASLAFFDECTERVDCDDPDSRLLELDESHHSERTVYIPPPEPTGLPSGATYSYQAFVMNPLLFSRKELKGLLGARLSEALPGSPLARRTKHEIKSAQKLARKHAASPDLWARCLLGTCYSLWFIHLPSYALLQRTKAPACLRTAYELLVRIQKMNLQPTDEVCYRVMMQLCGVYSQPVLAVKLLFQMKRSGIQPNAITYGFYNRAVLEATWPSDCTNSSQLLWNKLRNVIKGVALFRRAAARKRLPEEGGGLTDGIDGISRTSIDSGNSHEQPEITIKTMAVGPSKTGCCGEPCEESSVTLDQETEKSRHATGDSVEFAAFDQFRSRLGSIVRPSGISLLASHSNMQQQPFESSAGLLMTGLYEGPNLTEESDVFDCEGLADSPCLGPRRQRNRSGSCSEFMFGLRPHGPQNNCPTSPKTTRSPETSKDDCYRLLSRSESFASDAQILDNLNRLKRVLQKEGSLPNGRVGPTEASSKPWPRTSTSRSLFGRKSSFGIRSRQSRESSTETLEERSSGSAEDLDCAAVTPRRLSTGGKLRSVLHRLGTEVLSLAGGDEQPAKPSSPTQKTSPVRTPVTENDPLGALDTEEEGGHGEPQDSESTSLSSSATQGMTGILDVPEGTGGPVLFGGPSRAWGMSHSATFTHNGGRDEDELLELEEPPCSKVLHRSSTMPVDVAVSSGVTASLGSLGSSFKLPFSSRFSPARLSLRKADLRTGTQIIENAIANFSPSSLTSKKSNELLQGGLNSLKSAATSVVKKFDEIKEAISVNSTPVKAGAGHGRTSERENSYYEDDMVDCGSTAGVVTENLRRVSSEFSPLAVHMHLDTWGTNLLDLFGEGSRKGSVSNLQPLGSVTSSQQQLFPENLYPRETATRESRVPLALEIVMTTCSKCHNCSSVLYDEEIMAGWVPEDSNLNTKCQFCSKATVPFLTVTVLDYRSQPMMVPAFSQESVWTGRGKSSLSQLSHLGVSSTSVDSSSLMDGESSGGTPKHQASDHQNPAKLEEGSEPPITLEPITVPYLNPLVLRKEFENILHHEGDSCLIQPGFVDDHPIIYWNMVWVFQRINVVSHLPGLSLQAATVNKDQAIHSSWTSADHNNIVIRCMWDNPRLHEEVGQPMYVLWQQNEQQSSLVSALVTDRTTVPRSVMHLVISSVRCNDLLEPLKKLATERHKLKGRGVIRSHSLYRDILFLAFTVMGRDNIDQGAFDREYMAAFERLPETDLKLFHRADRPVTNAALWCRHYFKELEL